MWEKRSSIIQVIYAEYGEFSFSELLSCEFSLKCGSTASEHTTCLPYWHWFPPSVWSLFVSQEIYTDSQFGHFKKCTVFYLKLLIYTTYFCAAIIIVFHVQSMGMLLSSKFLDLNTVITEGCCWTQFRLKILSLEVCSFKIYQPKCCVSS
jgi:hypothetical protein